MGLLWGFLKYHHPSVARGNYKWDNELFRILPEVISAGNNKERDAVFLAWVKRLGPVTVSAEKPALTDSIKMKPDLDWIHTAGFDKQLVDLLMRIQATDRPEDHYYIGLAPKVGNPVFRNEHDYSRQKYPDAGMRLLALYRYWSIIQYFFPYKYLIGEDWKAILEMFIPKVAEAENELAYKLTMLQLIERIHDTHANIWSNEPVLNQHWGVNYAPYQIQFIEDQAVVTGYIGKSAPGNNELRLGDVIERVDGKPVGTLIKEWLPYTPASNYPTKLRNIAANVLRTNDSTMELAYLRNGQKNRVVVNTYPPGSLQLNKRYGKPDTCFRLITDSIGYLYLGSIKNQYLPELKKEIDHTKALIIDLRCYPSEFVVFSMGGYLVPDSRPFVKFSFPVKDQPGLFALSAPIQVGEQSSIGSYSGKVVILVNELTQSQAEYTTMAFRTAPRATVIGSTTAGADGNVSGFTLPGGIRTMISGLGVYYPDGRGTQRVGIIPDIEIKPTIAGIREGRDELLEKAIEVLSSQR